MNEIILPLLTVLVNAVVMGFIVHHFQKKTENLFAKELEQFRVELQYSLFVEQSKFTRIHEKRVNTLEMLCDRFKDFSNSVTKGLNDIFSFYLSRREEMDRIFDEISFEQPFQVLDVFWNDYVNSRLFLPQDIINKIERMYEDSYQILLTVIVGIQSSDSDFSTLNEMIETSNLKYIKTVSRRLSIELFLHQARDEINNQVLELEGIYKSVADIKEEIE